MAREDSYTFQKDIKTLQYNVEILSKDNTPAATERACNRIKAILDRILENRRESYVPLVVKQYFKEEEED